MTPQKITIARSAPHGHIVDALVRRLEDDVARALGVEVEEARGEMCQKLARKRLYFPLARSEAVLMVAMGTYRIALNAADFLAARDFRAAWLFDAWPESYDALRKIATRLRLTHLFITAKQSAEVLSKTMSDCRVFWLPEPLVNLGFKPLPWSERLDTAVQFGRKYDAYHVRLLAEMSGRPFEYLFEHKKGALMAESTEEFLRILGSSKVSVCFPSSTTHPARSGSVSTMTQRYLQSMASGCVVVGAAPPEMTELFGYDPVVKADLADPAGQIEAIIAGKTEYRDLVERNFESLARHSVAERCKVIVEKMT